MKENPFKSLEDYRTWLNDAIEAEKQKTPSERSTSEDLVANIHKRMALVHEWNERTYKHLCCNLPVDINTSDLTIDEWIEVLMFQYKAFQDLRNVRIGEMKRARGNDRVALQKEIDFAAEKAIALYSELLLMRERKETGG